MSNPYERMSRRSFWKPSVGSLNPLEISELYRARIALSKQDKIVTAGSCFAQHIGRALQRNGFNWFDAEPGPSVSKELKKKYSYGIFSFRTGNIYTAVLLEQWIDWAIDPTKQDEEVWEDNGKYYDPVRPVIEPDGFVSKVELLKSRSQTLEAICRSIKEAKLFVFTMGLTEGWVNKDTDLVYAMCPGTIAGSFDENVHEFVNYGFNSVRSSMLRVMEKVRRINPEIKFLLTVSPVPLTATATDEHVLVATVHSKSILRAVAGDLYNSCEYVDYFPSYEIIASPAYRGFFYQANQRQVSVRGVDYVMSQFFSGLEMVASDQQSVGATGVHLPNVEDRGDVECEEALLEAFGA